MRDYFRETVYVRVSKLALLLQGRYAHARKWKQAQKQTKRLKTYLGRVVRELRRNSSAPTDVLTVLLSKGERLLAQQPKDTHKLHSIHEPEVECIAKGKAHKKYEFGCKVSAVTTSRGNWVVGLQSRPGNPYDGSDGQTHRMATPRGVL
jgi:IS5 family transposase